MPGMSHICNYSTLVAEAEEILKLGSGPDHVCVHAYIYIHAHTHIYGKKVRLSKKNE